MVHWAYIWGEKKEAQGGFHLTEEEREVLGKVTDWLETAKMETSHSDTLVVASHPPTQHLLLIEEPYSFSFPQSKMSHWHS